MQLQAQNLGKRYRYDWVFKDLNYTFDSSKSYAIAGPNGSGKSTLLKVLSGFLSPSKGEVAYSLNGKSIGRELIFQHTMLAAPYIDLIEEWTLEEAIQFHFRFKKLKPSLSLNELPDRFQLGHAVGKEVRFFSSGMKQRLKLGLAFATDCPFILLDEPTSNLDDEGMAWYRSEVEGIHSSKDQLLFVASNVAIDFDFCEEQLKITDYKPSKTKRRKLRLPKEQ